MCAMSRDEQAAPSPDVLATEGRGRCFLSPGERARGSRQQSEGPDKWPTTTVTTCVEAGTENEEPALHFHPNPSM